MAEHRSLIRAAERPAELEFRHPVNPASEIRGWQLSRLTGLTRTALNFMCVPPGRESFVAHSHTAEEEWIYVLSGRGMARIGDQELEVGPGDFMGFSTPSVVHHLRNPFAEDLVYLCGGEIRAAEIAEYPDQGLVLVRQPNAAYVVPKTALRRIQ
jgi:uncharacterized cupin superfamily protein